MMLDIVIEVIAFILITILTWLRRAFLLESIRNTLRRFKRVWGRLVIAKSPKLIIRTARAAALKFCLQAIPASKNSARNIKREEIVSAFSHYQNSITQIRADKPDNSKDKITDAWIAALIKAGEFLGGKETMASLTDEGWIPNAIKFSEEDLILGESLVDLKCWIHIHRDKTYRMDANPYPRNSFGEDADKSVNAVAEIPGLNEFIELLERVGLKMIKFSDILKSLQQAEFPYTPESFPP